MRIFTNPTRQKRNEWAVPVGLPIGIFFLALLFFLNIQPLFAQDTTAIINIV